MYACSWLIYAYTYAINYADTICTDFADSREIRTCICVYVCVYVCVRVKLYTYTACARHRRLSVVRLMRGMLRTTDRRWRMKLVYILFRSHCFYTRKERWENEESSCCRYVCFWLLCRNIYRAYIMYRVPLRVCIYVYVYRVSHTRVYATSRWCAFPLADH